MRTRLLLCTPVVIALAACGSGGSDPDSIPQGPGPTLNDRTFLSVDVTGHELVDGTRIALTFDENDHIAVNAGCNSFSGTWRIEGGKLVVSGLGGTEMGCDPYREQQDVWLTDLLRGGPQFAHEDDSMTLTSGAVVISLRDKRVVVPDKPLVQTLWIVDTVITGDAASHSLDDGRASLQITEGQLDWHDGCNTFRAPVDVGDETTIRVGELEQYGAFAKCVGGIGTGWPWGIADDDVTLSVEIDGDRLTLSGPGDRGLGLVAN